MFVKSTRFKQVCQLLLSLIVATEGKIKTLRLDTPKKACLSLNVEVTGSKARKDTFPLAQVHLHPPIQELQILLDQLSPGLEG